jgi:hypothetical protein
MSNHVINEMIFRNVDEAAQARIIAATCNAEGKVDFEVLVPVPLNMWWGNEGLSHERAFGSRLSMPWARANWGTKWNAYDHRPHEISGDTLTLRFETAWTPPYPWLAAVFNSLKLDFDHNWMSEGGEPGMCGKFRVGAGDIMGDRWDEAEGDEAMQRYLHKLLWGVEKFDDEEDSEPQTQTKAEGVEG